jgi:adenine-specific DNA-methyltransferase
MKDGFAANCIFFKLNFLDKTQVALGRQFRELLPILWMKAGAEGICPRLTSDEIPQMLVLPENRFAVLTDEKAFSEFLEKVDEQDSIRIIYLVVDSDSMYREMARCFPKRQTCQLYRDYLDNFRINNVR